VLAYRHGDPAWNTRVTPESPVILAQLLHGRDAEMAQTADDLIWRRTELGPCGHASPAVTHTAQAVLDARPDQ
jgi:glycerol-3-phosphate dehydrogenase